MRLYLIVTAALFVLLAIVHVWRIAVEGGGPLHEADFLIASVVAIGMAVWAIVLLRRMPRG